MYNIYRIIKIKEKVMNLYDTIMKNSKLVNITKKSDVLELNTTFRLYNIFCNR